MTVRNGMIDLIADMRVKTDAGTADFTAGTVTYWSDQHIQDALDKWQIYRPQAPTMAVQEYSGGTPVYLRYESGLKYLETSDTTGAFEVQDSAGSAIGTALYTMDFNSGVLTFASDTGGSVYYLKCYQYDVNRSAADIWTRKAAQYAKQFDFSTDNHSIKKSQQYDFAMMQAAYYAAGGDDAGMVGSAVMHRGDDTDARGWL